MVHKFTYNKALSDLTDHVLPCLQYGNSKITTQRRQTIGKRFIQIILNILKWNECKCMLGKLVGKLEGSTIMWVFKSSIRVTKYQNIG